MKKETAKFDWDEQARLLKIKEQYLEKNPFKLNKKLLQDDAEAISMFISFASGTIQY